MTDELTFERLTAIRAREQAATPGPWKVGTHDHPLGCSCMSCLEPAVGHYIDHPLANYCDDIVAIRNGSGERNANGQPLTSCDFSAASVPLLSYVDADFAVHARVDIPLLLTEVDDLRRQIDAPRWSDVSADMFNGRIQLTGDGGTNIADLPGDRAVILRDMLTDLINERASQALQRMHEAAADTVSRGLLPLYGPATEGIEFVYEDEAAPLASGGIVTKPVTVGEGGPPPLFVPTPGPELPVDWSKAHIVAKFGAGFPNGIQRDEHGKATALGVFGYAHPLGAGRCENCGQPVLHNLAVGFCSHDDEALNATCPQPYPAVPK
jgi:hypothetical protein